MAKIEINPSGIATALLLILGVGGCIYALAFAEGTVESVAYAGAGMALLAEWLNCKLYDRIRALEKRIKEMDHGQEAR